MLQELVDQGWLAVVPLAVPVLDLVAADLVALAPWVFLELLEVTAFLELSGALLELLGAFLELEAKAFLVLLQALPEAPLALPAAWSLAWLAALLVASPGALPAVLPAASPEA